MLQLLISKIADSYNPAYGRDGKSETRGDPFQLQLKKWFFTPLLAPMLRNRWLVLVFVAFGVVQLLLILSGLTGWQCPIYENIGITCPGCGLSTAMAMLLKGHWRAAVHTHAFSPMVLTALVMMLIAGLLPASWLGSYWRSVERLEHKYGITAIILISMVVYWLIRTFEFI